MNSTQEKNMGFSMIELLVSISILIIMTGVTTGLALHYRTVTQEKSYMIEAGSVFDALELVLIDRVADGTYDLYEFLDDFSFPRSCDKLLEPYLSGKRTKGAKVYRMLMEDSPPKLLEMEYIVSGYTILVSDNGTITIIDRPD